MNLRILVLATVAMSGCDCSERIQRACDRPCLPDGITVCQPGLWVCGDDGQMTCEGWVGPSPEVCDGQDNDCDGIVDNLPNPYRECHSICGKGLEVCQFGQYVKCSADQPEPEVCDGRDNDCDGIVDNPEALPVAPCYQGPTETLRYGLCRPGITRCIGGHSQCYGEILPGAEICNGIDDNCDGRIDEGLGNPKPTDIIVVLDRSPSMEIYLTALNSAVTAFVNQNADAGLGIDWALVMAPDANPNLGSSVVVRADIGSAADFLTALHVQMQATTSGVGTEPNGDAVYDICTSSNPLGLHFPAGHRQVVAVLSDENVQSYNQPLVGPGDIGSTCADAGVQVWTYTNMGDSWAVLTWNTVSVATGTVLQNIASPTLATDLQSLLQKVTCSP